MVGGGYEHALSFLHGLILVMILKRFIVLDFRIVRKFDKGPESLAGNELVSPICR